MKCPNCNNDLAADDKFCQHCGTAVPAQSDAQKIEQAMEDTVHQVQSSVTEGASTIKNNFESMQKHPQYVLFLVLSIVEIVLCCFSFGGLVGGILGIILNQKTNTAFMNNNTEEYEKFKKYTVIALIAGVAVSILINIFFFITGTLTSLIAEL